MPRFTNNSQYERSFSISILIQRDLSYICYFDISQIYLDTQISNGCISIYAVYNNSTLASHKDKKKLSSNYIDARNKTFPRYIQLILKCIARMGGNFLGKSLDINNRQFLISLENTEDDNDTLRNYFICNKRFMQLKHSEIPTISLEGFIYFRNCTFEIYPEVDIMYGYH